MKRDRKKLIKEMKEKQNRGCLKCKGRAGGEGREQIHLKREKNKKNGVGEKTMGEETSKEAYVRTEEGNRPMEEREIRETAEWGKQKRCEKEK